MRTQDVQSIDRSLFAVKQ